MEIWSGDRSGGLVDKFCRFDSIASNDAAKPHILAKGSPIRQEADFDWWIRCFWRRILLPQAFKAFETYCWFADVKRQRRTVFNAKVI